MKGGRLPAGHGQWPSGLQSGVHKLEMITARGTEVVLHTCTDMQERRALSAKQARLSRAPDWEAFGEKSDQAAFFFLSRLSFRWRTGDGHAAGRTGSQPK